MEEAPRARSIKPEQEQPSAKALSRGADWRGAVCMCT